MKSLRICNVSVNPDSLPEEKVLIEEAMKTRPYRDDSKGVEKVKAEIKASGIYKTNAKEKSDGLHSDSSRETDGAKPRK